MAIQSRVLWVAAALCAGIATGLQAAEATAVPSVYMGGPVELVKAPNGAITNRKLLDRVGAFNWLEPTIENPAPGIWVFGGFGLAPMSIIEAEDGLIAFDTGDTKHDGELMLKAIRTVSKKPIKVIIYGHSHTVAGAAVLAEGNKDIMVIGHPNLNEVVKQNLGGGGAPAFYPEVGPYLTGRALTQFNAYMPREGPDAYVLPTNLKQIDLAFLPVNRPVQDGEEMTIMGIKFQFFTKYGSDDKVRTTVWLPERRIVFTTLLWSASPQLYTLRGDVFRDPREWIAGLRFTRDLNPEVLISAASKPIVGAAKIRETLEHYVDGASFVLDQSLCGILGGRVAVLQVAQAALDKKEYAWAAKLANPLYLSQATPGDPIQAGEIKVGGDAAEAARLINLFDRYRPEKAVVIPPALLEHAH